MENSISTDPFMPQRQRMIEEQLISRGIKDRGVLQAMTKVQRHRFVLPEALHLAYGDHPVSIGFGQTISQPYIVALMTEALSLKPQDCVLEIGTGCGYQTTILAEIAYHVYSVENIAELSRQAEENILKLGYKNVSFHVGDGYDGWLEHAPYDAIIVTAAPVEIPQELIAQMKTGGRMVIPVGEDVQELYLITKTPDDIKAEGLGRVRFVPMIEGEGGR